MRSAIGQGHSSSEKTNACVGLLQRTKSGKGITSGCKIAQQK